MMGQLDLNQSTKQLLSKLPSIQRIIFRITYVVMATEILIMLAFDYILPTMSSLMECFVDGALLVMLTTPVIYFTIIKPYVLANRELLKRMHILAFHDDLTGLNNRRSLLEYLERLLAYNIRHSLYAALLFIDLNEFKKVNDTYGHDAGDKVLSESSKRLLKCVRKEDIVCRMGGDEFVILLGNLGAEQQIAHANALAIAERIQYTLKQAIEHKTQTLQVGLSIGLRLIAPEAQSIEHILGEADAAMYQAKIANQADDNIDNIIVHAPDNLLTSIA